jgi:hypothetical protein
VQTAVEAGKVRGFNVLHWSSKGMASWAVSDVNEAELREFVTALRAAQQP